MLKYRQRRRPKDDVRLNLFDLSEITAIDYKSSLLVGFRHDRQNCSFCHWQWLVMENQTILSYGDPDPWALLVVGLVVGFSVGLSYSDDDSPRVNPQQYGHLTPICVPPPAVATQKIRTVALMKTWRHATATCLPR